MTGPAALAGVMPGLTYGLADVLVDGDAGGRGGRLVAPRRSADVLRGRLAAAGYTPVRGQWARFTGAGVDAVRVTDLESLRLPAEDAGALLAQATGPVPRLPAAHHALLLAAARLVELEGPGDLLQDEAARLLATGEQVRLAALRRALGWGLVRAMTHLERVGRGGTVTAADRADALVELSRVRGGPVGPPSGFVVALSGLDGSGKSSQALALRTVLQDLDRDVAVQWTRLSASPLLDIVARPVKRALRSLRGTPAPPDRAATGPGAAPEAARGTALDWGWGAVLAGVDGLERRRAVAVHLRQGRAVLCDRWALDSLVQLQVDYGRAGPLPRGLLTALAPAPLAAFLLEVDAAEAHRRKPEQYDARQLAAQADSYRRAAADLGVTVLDGTHSREQVTEQVARAVWAALARRDGP